MKFSYKSLFITIYLAYGVLFLTLSTVASIYYNSSNVNNISTENFKAKFKERDNFINTYFEPTKDSLYAITHNEDFKEFIATGEKKDIVQHLFATIKHSIGCLNSIRYIDTNANEIIKIDGGPQHILKEKAKVNIAKDNELINISHRYYVREFLNLKKDEVGYSNMDIEMASLEKDGIRKPIIRVAISVFDKDERKGFVVINLCLREFFNSLNKTTLYNVYLVDNKGQFILYGSNANAIERLHNNPYTLYSHFDTLDAPMILSRETFTKDTYYVARTTLRNQQDIKMILEIKFDRISKEDEQTKLNILYIMIAVIVLSFPIALHFAKQPDKLLKDLKEQILTDTLTSLDNRTKLLLDIKQNKNNIIILINIDGFKEINNVFGYKSADKLLITLGEKLNQFVRQNKKYHLYKMASDEFAITYKYDNLQALQILIHKLNDLIEKEPYYCGDECEVYLSVTFGISDPDNIKASTDELREADLALKRAKKDKKMFEIYNQDMLLLETYTENLYITKEIKLALQNDDIVLNYQPIFRNDKKRIQKYEVLQRIRTQDGQILPPFKYLDIAKANKHYFLLTKKVIDKSFRYFSDKDYEFSINIGYADIVEEELLNYLKLSAQEHNVENRVVIEIIESDEITNYDVLANFIKEAKECGFKIAIDDFGSGYSNFEQILRLSDYIDYIKIDGTLIKNIIDDKKSQIIVKTIAKFCKELHIETIAEFVSDKEIYDYMQKLDIDFSQGYYISAPTPEIVTEVDI
jgi:diguanylate cyclase (GGDEF)-like protein